MIDRGAEDNKGTGKKIAKAKGVSSQTIGWRLQLHNEMSEEIKDYAIMCGHIFIYIKRLKLIYLSFLIQQVWLRAMKIYDGIFKTFNVCFSSFLIFLPTLYNFNNVFFRKIYTK